MYRLGLFLMLGSCAGVPPRDGRDAVAGYLHSLSRSDGGFGWADEPTGHVTVTHSAVASLRLLGLEVDHPEARIAFLRDHHPYRGPNAESRRHAAEIRTFTWEQVRGIQLLGGDVSSFVETARGWTKPSSYPKSYERSAYPLLQQEAMIVFVRDLLDLPAEEISRELVSYFDSRRRPDGSFNNSPGSDGSGGHVGNTFWCLRALKLLGRPWVAPERSIAWLRACQLPGGGFTWQPDAPVAAVDGIDSTWAALRALDLLGASPRDPQRAVDYVLSLWNADGGFGPRPGRRSDPRSTFRALEALSVLGTLDLLRSRTPRSAAPAETLPDGLRVYTIQLEAPGAGSPEEAATLAGALGIHLWGAKNSKPGWIEAAQGAADHRGIPVTFFPCDEEYGTYVGLPGFGVYSHIVDLMAPPGRAFGSSMAGKDPSWETFRKERIAPLEKAGGSLIWQLCDNEEYACVILDDALERGGYAAISTFHMRQNFVDILPFVMRYRGAIPFVSLLDAHGRESWSYVTDLVGHRTLFLAADPTWEGWREALRHDRVVAVRHDANTRFRTRMLGGTAATREFVRSRMDDWRWWGGDAERIRRPLVSIVAVRPDDGFEAGRPVRGIALRVRVGHENNPGGVLIKPLARLEEVTLDGRPVAMKPVEVRDGRERLVDAYHVAVLNDLKPGRYVAKAVVRSREDEARRSAMVEFSIQPAD